MTSGTIIIIIVIVILIILAYVLSILARKRNESLLDQLEERKEALFNLPVNDEIEEVKNLHLIGQSQVTFREWNQKWVDLSLNSFADIENQIFEAEGFNQSFRFFRAKAAIESIDSQINLIAEDIEAIREALHNLNEQESRNSGRVRHALDLFDNLQNTLSDNEERYGETLPELQKQFLLIESEFSEFVTLNTSGDPIEASSILDRTEEHMIALTKIMERVPVLIEKLSTDIPDQLDDLESGYRKLVEENYQFPSEDIETRLQNIRMSVKDNMTRTAEFDLDRAEQENQRIQDEVDDLYELFTKEIAAHQEVVKLTKYLPAYIKHIGDSNQKLQGEVERLSQSYLLSDSKLGQIQRLSEEFEELKESLAYKIEHIDQPELPYSVIKEELESSKVRLSDIEEDQISLADYLNIQEQSDAHARRSAANFIHKLHTIKRYMEKRNLPGIPQLFLSHFFTTSNHVEALLESLDPQRVDMDKVNRLLEIATSSLEEIETEAYHIVQQASLTEQLLQYSNRYRAHDVQIQEAFDTSLAAFEKDFDYDSSFKRISQALESVEPGVTARFVNSYERTREAIRY